MKMIQPGFFAMIEIIDLLLALISIFLVACGETVSSTDCSGDFKLTFGLAFDNWKLLLIIVTVKMKWFLKSQFDSSVVGSSTVTIKYKDAQTSFQSIFYLVFKHPELRFIYADILQSSSRYDIRVEDSSICL